ncbi:MAG: T9SS type A sorting domain-containing protein, partial [Bacteroidota bacterium]
NHSGWLSEDRSTYYMADETWGRDIKVMDVSDPTNLEIIDTIDAGSNNPFSIAHNQIVHCNHLFVSYYYDGLQIYNIENPKKPVRTHFYATSNLNPRMSYEGAWGIYPFLPSGNILVSDMQGGLFVFESINSCTTSSFENSNYADHFEIFPNPVKEKLNIVLSEQLSRENLSLQLQTIDGRIIWSTASILNNRISIDNLPSYNGLYLLTLRGEDFIHTQKVIINN